MKYPADANDLKVRLQNFFFFSLPSGFVPELGLLCCDDAHLQLRGLEVDGENGRQTRDGRLFWRGRRVIIVRDEQVKVT